MTDIAELKKRAAAGDKKAAWEYAKLEAARLQVEFEAEMDEKIESLSTVDIGKAILSKIKKISKQAV